MNTWRTFTRALSRFSDRLALPGGFPADGRSLGLGLAAALENQRRAAVPSDEEIARFLRGSASEDDLATV
ncbi:hypothetical protein [Micromonospora sp. HM5-17]|jgi:hypothetical protein|uniref:hypothetical protein n=1 Tax=Micromonospora sp. HM5-17 TaxID=2487710 RepID=UPI000F478DDE|nr:hypothetical protein [Micromonospora sp. HM5-17]ROT33062.1 hypothetical protein EF879_07965 [Micromonospora sp. HM5-17]